MITEKVMVLIAKKPGLTSAEIVDSTGLTYKQVGHVFSSQKHKLKRVPPFDPRSVRQEEGRWYIADVAPAYVADRRPRVPISIFDFAERFSQRPEAR